MIIITNTKSTKCCMKSTSQRVVVESTYKLHTVCDQKQWRLDLHKDTKRVFAEDVQTAKGGSLISCDGSD